MTKAPALPQLRDQQVLACLSQAQRTDLTNGRHFDVAAQLIAQSDFSSAAWVYEQVWAYGEAVTYYLQSRRYGDALRVALLDAHGASLEKVVRAILDDSLLESHERELYGRWLLSKRRPEPAARILERSQAASAPTLVQAYLAQGDPLKAAQALASAGDFSQAQEILREQAERTQDKGRINEELAKLAWQLGEDEEAVALAQEALRCGYSTTSLLQLTASALRNLDHPIAARLVLGDVDGPVLEGHETSQRFRIVRSLPAFLSGESYLALDRSNHCEVELHLLFTELRDSDFAGMADTVERFCEAARSAAAIGHPAILPILELNSASGMMVTPRYSGRTLRQEMRDLSQWADDEHRQAMFLFLAEGLAAAHARGVVHGSLLPSQMYLDALDRPLLGPFGAHLLSGLAATRTGSLEELMGVMAPEIRFGEQPTFASDVYSLGALGRAMFVGHYTSGLAQRDGETPATAGPLGTLLRDMLHPSAIARPEIDECIREIRALGPSRRVWRKPRYRMREAMTRSTGQHNAGLLLPFQNLRIHDSWSLAAIDTLLAHDSSLLQTIVGHTETRTLQLLSWPDHLPERALLDLDVVEREGLLQRWRVALGDTTLEEILQRASSVRIREACKGDYLLDLASVLGAAPDHATGDAVGVASSTCPP